MVKSERAYNDREFAGVLEKLWELNPLKRKLIEELLK